MLLFIFVCVIVLFLIFSGTKNFENFMKVNLTNEPMWRGNLFPTTACGFDTVEQQSMDDYFYTVTGVQYTDNEQTLNDNPPTGWYYSDRESVPAAEALCYTEPQCNWVLSRKGVNYYYNRKLPKYRITNQLSDSVYKIKNVKKFLSQLGSLGM